MKNYYVTFRSVTFAQKGERVLKRAGVNCILRRTPKMLTDKTCGYSLQIRPGDLEKALELLQGEQVKIGKVYGLDFEGQFEEMTV